MSSFSAVTRPTRRDMVKHPWRSLAGRVTGGSSGRGTHRVRNRYIL